VPLFFLRARLREAAPAFVSSPRWLVDGRRRPRCARSGTDFCKLSSFANKSQAQAFRKHVHSSKFFQQKRDVFSLKWKYLPPVPGKIFRLAAIFAGRENTRQISAGTIFPAARKIDV
jgi:hypothetical protein